jgi:orotidine-5'-phosphate decarboxylase
MTRSEAVAKLCVALDFPDAQSALELARELRNYVGLFKVGSELFTASGPAIVQSLTEAGANVFLDLKFNDIPNTVAGVSKVATGMGVKMFNVHASGGPEMLRTAAQSSRETAESLGVERPLLIAVTVLTSFDDELLHHTMGTNRPVSLQVQHLAKMAQDAGLDGVVASPLEIESIRAACGTSFLTVIPGVRTKVDAHGDQRRVMTPQRAIEAGADFLVIGRPITAARDPLSAVKTILAEMQASTPPTI